MAIARSNQVMECMPFKAPRKDLKDFRAFLGPPSERYNDAQLEQLHREMYDLADLLPAIYVSPRRNIQDVDILSSGGTMKPERSKNELPPG